MAEQEYQRLTFATGRSAFGIISLSRASLWLGKDHLLCVETSGYSESYKRFYFRDIQAFSFRRTNARMVLSIVLAVMAALFLLIAFIADNTTVLVIFVSLTPLLCLVPLVINLILGPTCRCQVRTAVQTEDLPIRRIRGARRFLERVRPLISAAQGELTAEEIAVRMQEFETSSSNPTAIESPGSMAAPEVVDDPNAPPRIAS
jgi:hypothetical protein